MSNGKREYSRSPEEKYYDEICAYLSDDLSNALRPLGNYKICFQKCGTKDMSWGLTQIFKALHVSGSDIGINTFLTRDLFVDIVGFIYNAENLTKHTVIICEVKMHSLTLNDFAQLLGYCVASNTEHCLLISVDHEISSRFDSVLRHNDELKKVKRPRFEHKSGILTWRSQHKEMQYHPSGFYRSVSILARALVISTNKVI